jgi:transcription elongation factor Elf1
MNLHPFHEVAANAESKIAAGWDIYQQFNCAHCGMKQTMADKNKFFTLGNCEECGRQTDIVKDGCNFMATKQTSLADAAKEFGK